MSTIELSNLLLHVYWPRKPNIYCTLHTNEVEGIYSAKISLFKKNYLIHWVAHSIKQIGLFNS